MYVVKLMLIVFTTRYEHHSFSIKMSMWRFESVQGGVEPGLGFCYCYNYLWCIIYLYIFYWWHSVILCSGWYIESMTQNRESSLCLLRSFVNFLKNFPYMPSYNSLQFYYQENIIVKVMETKRLGLLSVGDSCRRLYAFKFLTY